MVLPRHPIIQAAAAGEGSAALPRLVSGCLLLITGVALMAADVVEDPTDSRSIVPAAPPYRVDRILVQPKPGAATTKLAAWQETQGHRVHRTFPRLAGLQVVVLPARHSALAAVATYENSGWVSFAELDYRVSATASLPNDPRFQDGTLWGLNNDGQSDGLPDADIDAPAAWELLRSASHVIVAIIDSGIRPSHEDLAANLWQNPADGSPGYNALTGSNDPWDDYGHGTKVAGIIGGRGNNAKGVTGVAWQVQLMACKFLDPSGDGYYSDAIACLEFARSHGAHVINVSWGGNTYSAAFSNAVYTARAEGILFAAAAGNNAVNTDLAPYYPANMDLDNVISVGASTRRDTLYATSNQGRRTVDLFAPGAAIYSTAHMADDAYASWSGTSAAAGFVAGALALLREQSPGSSADELVMRLLTGVDRGPAFTDKCVTGGRLNLARALDQPSLMVASPPSSTQPIALNLAGVPERAYVILASEDLSVWSPVATNVTGSDGRFAIRDPVSTNRATRFYRAMPRQ